MPDFEPTRLPPLVWRESPNHYERKSRPDKVKPVRLIVIHTAEGSYEGTIAFFAGSASEASSHYVINDDGSDVTQMVKLGDRAWTQAAFNPEAISMELSGSLSTRFLHPGRAYKQMRTTARLVAWLLHEYKLPAAHVGNNSRFTGKGHARHGDLAPEGGHPFCLVYKRANWRLFRRWVRKETERGHFRPEYGKK